MNIFFLVVSTIFGLLVGSFLNVVALRFNTGKSLGGRSGCFSCGKQLVWYELFPVFSWLAQLGRCRGCSSKISPQYILGELAAGITYFLIAARAFFVHGFDVVIDVNYLIGTIFLFVLFSVALVILFYDIRHKIIPNELSFTFGLLSFLALFFFGFEKLVFTYVGFHIPGVWQLLAGLIVPLPFVLIWLFSRGAWIGLGDPKFMVGMGFLFGISRGFSSVFLSFWVGALFVLAIGVINFIFKKRLLHEGKKSIMKSELPFAPFLIIATLITVVCGFNFLAVV